jgi:cysteine-rich repeat protein
VDLPPGYEWVVFRVSGLLDTHTLMERWQVARMDGTLHQVAVDLQTACLAMPCAVGEECVAGVCRAAPRPEGWTSSCGDGVPDAPEECDGGEVFNSDTRRDACRTDCHLPGCGDTVIDTGEQCDDGNTTPGDGCSSTCQTEAGG